MTRKSSVFIFACMLFSVLLYCGFNRDVYAKSINDGIGRTSFTWLKTISDAGISATGESFAARDGYSGLLVHPAAIAGITTGTVKMSYVSHYVDTQYGSIGYARRLKNQSIGIRLSYLNYGEFIGRTVDNEPTGTFSAGDIGLTLNTGKKLRDDLKVGAMVSFLSSKLDDFTARIVTLDVGAVYYPPFEGLTVGAVLMNMGKVLKGYTSGYDETLPVYLSVGIRKELAHAPLTIFSDVQFPNDYDITYSYGIEAAVKDILFLYFGTKSRSRIEEDSLKSKTDFFARATFGFGVVLKNYRFNYAYCPDNDIEDIHKITLGLNLR